VSNAPPGGTPREVVIVSRRSKVNRSEKPINRVHFTKVNIGFETLLFDNEKERLFSLCFGQEFAGGGVYNR